MCGDDALYIANAGFLSKRAGTFCVPSVWPHRLSNSTVSSVINLAQSATGGTIILNSENITLCADNDSWYHDTGELHSSANSVGQKCMSVGSLVPNIGSLSNVGVGYKKYHTFHCSSSLIKVLLVCPTILSLDDL